MTLKIKKILLILIPSIIVVYAQGENGPGSNGDIIVTPGDEALQFNKVVLDVVATRLSAAKLPPELEMAGQQILADTEEGLVQCSETLSTAHLIWQSKVCAAAQMRNALAAINALQMTTTTVPTSSA